MLNKLYADGSIKLDDENNIIVSPYADNFYDEIEVGVREPVRALLEMGYLTIASCDGNHIFNGTAQVTVVLNSKQWAYNLIYDLKQLGIDADIDNTFTHFSLEHVNNLFMRRYSEYICVKIYVYDHRFFFAPFKKHIIKRNTRLLKYLGRYTA
jgi:hypothetical protein